MDHIRKGATVTFALDVLVMLTWAAVGIAILASECWAELAVIHVLIFIHYGAQLGALAGVLEIVGRDEWEEKHLSRESRPPPQIPIAWATVSGVTLLGDIFIVCYDAKHFASTPPDDHCYKVSAAQLAVDIANTVTATCSLICYVVAVYHLRNKRNRYVQDMGGVDETTPLPTTTPTGNNYEMFSNNNYNVYHQRIPSSPVPMLTISSQQRRQFGLSAAVPVTPFHTTDHW